MRYLAIIPARYASSRFPGKPLAMLGGQPVVQHVYKRAGAVFDEVCVATDDERIRATVESFGGCAVMTSTAHRSGTDRCYEAYCKLRGLKNGEALPEDVVVNIQGDEPFITSRQLLAVKECFTDKRTEIATLVKPFGTEVAYETLENPNSPKVVLSEDSFALYFSRSVIPYLRGIPNSEWPRRHRYLKHIGLYAYKADVLCQLTSLAPSVLEGAESLEQLRWLQAGFRIKAEETNEETIGIDTPEDLARAEEFFHKVKL